PGLPGRVLWILRQGECSSGPASAAVRCARQLLSSRASVRFLPGGGFGLPPSFWAVAPAASRGRKMSTPGRSPMGRIARVSRRLALFLLFALPAVLPAATLPELFRKAKEEVKLGSYDSALKTLEELEAGANQPGFEKDKA